MTSEANLVQSSCPGVKVLCGSAKFQKDPNGVDRLSSCDGIAEFNVPTNVPYTMWALELNFDRKVQGNLPTRCNGQRCFIGGYGAIRERASTKISLNNIALLNDDLKIVGASLMYFDFPIGSKTLELCSKDNKKK